MRERLSDALPMQPPLDTALRRVWMQGAAADLAVAEGCGPRGLTASELLPRIRRLNQ